VSKKRLFSFFRFVTINKYSDTFDDFMTFSILQLMFLPFWIFVPIILKGYFFSGIILMDCFICSPA